ncbi:thioredoxin domain-containing protein [Novosphingobium sp. MMS21-SN21R]|uniref:DsbA family protein n=1 Tax=Novosphingobium sp. MMS21-SN21R TaxID=2969298 RepID=UPI002888571C|nr:thioredoxin domain-containing protein [Novosphingobium sp. MMS21-SN21R]MDT0507290.1 thioredoxin domain-containing protein [Novosphingobium sp. MMS21-SN21R]
MKFARALLLAALPLTLGLAACDKKGDAATGEVSSSEPIAKISAPAGKNWTETFAVTPEGGYLLGNPNAPIKLIEFGALSCSHCAAFSKEGFPKLRDDYVASGRVSYELRLFLLNALDMPAALLATCGSPEAVIPLSEQFWEFQPTMFANLQKDDAAFQQVSNLPVDKRFAGIAQLGGMSEFFASRGIAAAQGASCLADTAKATKLATTNEQWSKEFDITGTPTFFLNGSKTGVATWAELEPMLQKAGAR